MFVIKYIFILFLLLQFNFDWLSRGRPLEAQLPGNLDLFGLGRGPSKDGRSHARPGLFHGNLKKITIQPILT